MMDDEVPEATKKYVFFTDSEIIERRAEGLSSMLNSRYLPKQEETSLNKANDYQIGSHPFTFLSAVKRKLAFAAKNEAVEQLKKPINNEPLNVEKTSIWIDEMDFIKPLKVPDMKISPKNLDFSARISQKPEKLSKVSAAHRKLDFSDPEGTLFITSDELEPIKSSDISLSSAVSKKKDYMKESSKENQNRVKKIQKDQAKVEESSDSLKKRLTKHTSRKDYDEIIHKFNKNDRFSMNSSKDSSSSDLLRKKVKQKGFVTSTTRKDDEKKTVEKRLINSHSGKSRDRSLEPRIRPISCDSVCDRNLKIRESSRGASNDTGTHKYPEDFSKIRNSSKKQHDQKIRQNTSLISRVSKNSDELDIHSSSRGKDSDKSQPTNISSTSESKVQSSEELFLDPRRISFRDDSYSNQDEFCNLVTPDMSLLYRPRKRRESPIVPATLQEPENIVIPQKSRENLKDPQESQQNINLVHPTALHMQFQAELHLFDSYNESLRQLMDVENCLYNVQQEKVRELSTIPDLEPKTNEKISKNHVQSVSEDDGEDQKSSGSQFTPYSMEIELKKVAKEVQTQTANDIATQTESSLRLSSKNHHPSITYSRGDLINQLSLGSIDEFDDFESLEKLQRLRTMSEISLHETTSSIKTETGTEISISTRDVTCSFNKYLDLEMAQLIKDEAQMYDKIEMLFKSREKTLNDRTRKLVKLEEQKRALRDTGQDSRISSVKKKQRALLLKLQQEKDEMNRLKELHKLASQERKLMLQKQRNMFNPNMLTKNILTKLKRSADCQSPRRLSGPMKGYDIRSNSSISSLVDSDKSQIDKSKQNMQKIVQNSPSSSQLDSPKKFEVGKGKFEERMPKGDIFRARTHQLELDEKLIQTRQGNFPEICPGEGQEQKSESDTLVEDLTRKFAKEINENEDFAKKKSLDKGDNASEILRRLKMQQERSQNIPEVPKQIPKKKNSKSLKGKSSGNVLTENILKPRSNILSSEATLMSHKRLKNDREDKKFSKNSILEELDMNESQNSIHNLVNHSKALKEKNCKLLKDIADEEATKENSSENQKELERAIDDEDAQNLGNISTKSQVSTLTISRHSSGDSEKSYSRSVVIRSQDHPFKAPKKLEQALNAREAAVATRRNCVEDWIAWHARLKAEESRVAKMEEAACKLISTSTNVLCNDTTVSSEASDIEGRVEVLAEKLAERRAEMAKLRREARKQAKQRLRALEANLLNQIKKYDTTIHEMRKKIDGKRSVKDYGKLAIEAKAVAEVKVPEIPIKRIQEIYKNSDLFRLHSESDLLTNYSSSENQNLSENTRTAQETRTVLVQSSELVSGKSKSSAVNTPTLLTSESSKSEKSPKSTEKSSVIPTKTREQPFSSALDFLQLNNQNLNNDISTLENDLKTLSEMMSKFSKKSDEKLRSALILTSEKEETLKSTLRDISDNFSKSQIGSDYQESIPEVIVTEDALSGKDFTDISYSSSIPIETKPSSQSLSHSPKVLDSNLNDENNEESTEMIEVDVTEVISSMIPSQDTSKISEEIDFNARSKEILNEIEKSIIYEKSLNKNSENNLEVSGAKLEKSMEDLHKGNKELSSDFNIIEGDIKSISEIISKMNESRQHLNFVEEINNEYPVQDNVDINFDKSNSLEKLSQHDDDLIEENLETPEIDEAGNESSLESSRMSSLKYQESSMEKNEENKNESDWTVSDSFEVPQGSLTFNKNLEDSELENSIAKLESSLKSPNFDNDSEVSYFLPTCESTSIERVGLFRLTDSEMERRMKQTSPRTDELDDILDIIQRDTQKMDLRKTSNDCPRLPPVPDELILEIRDDIVPENRPEFNLTEDVEPVLQQLTEVLQTVEKSIAQRVKSRELERISPRSSPEADIAANVQGKKLLTDNEPRKRVEFEDKVCLEIDFKDENLVETDIDEKGEIYQHLDEALDYLSNCDEDEDIMDGKNLSLTEENSKNIINNDSINEMTYIKNISKQQDILRDPEYEDISEESMEVSEIIDRSESFFSKSQKSDKFEKIQKTDDVLRILDEISQRRDEILSRNSEDKSMLPANFEQNDTLSKNLVGNEIIEKNGEMVESSVHRDDTSVESSDDLETSRDISKHDLDPPSEHNTSRLDIEILNDDLLSGISSEKSQNVEYNSSDIEPLLTSERDIEMMIDKLRASLDQPGLEVSELDARLLRIEQLQIELQIKKLEAEEVSFYVREIPNKPPPPYTPPGGPKTTSNLQITKFPAPVVPTSVEELTSFTEKATLLIYDAKQNGKDVLALESPTNIVDTEKQDTDEEKSDKSTEKCTKNDRKIYNSFLFDLCKETVAEIYQTEYERPGPSWTKPNFKTKTVIKSPKNIVELNDYVCKEVATLFGFKTKLQRENMVMRWSRKRRDRVDELLAREAQAEEDEWTKFHHDELAVKNELTVAILDTLILETTNVIKAAHVEKQKILAS